MLKRYQWIIGTVLVVLALQGGLELLMGRSPLWPDGRFGWWDGNVWGSENSQRVADAYTFSHLIHGILFYAGFWLVARKLPVRQRLIAALLLEAAWELLENSPLIINRYRAATIAQGYDGDSVLNSVCDTITAILGFLFAFRFRPWVSVAAILVLEIGCAIWIRDNLTLNVIMLIYPIEAIKQWQLAGKPG